MLTAAEAARIVEEGERYLPSNVRTDVGRVGLEVERAAQVGERRLIHRWEAPLPEPTLPRDVAEAFGRLGYHWELVVASDGSRVLILSW